MPRHKGALEPEAWRHPQAVDVERASRVATTVAIHLERNMYQAAIDVILAAKAEHQRSQQRGSVLDWPLAECGLELIILNRLEHLGILRVGQLLECSQAELAGMKQFGPIGLRKLVALGQTLAELYEQEQNGEMRA